MKEIITKIDREKGFNYSVDKKGNVIKEKYSILKDRWTVVTIIVLILAATYYIQLQDMRTTEKNFEPTCIQYMQLRELWIEQHPGQIPTLEEVFNTEVNQYPTLNG